MNIIIHTIKPKHYPLLENFLYYAIFRQPDKKPLPRKTIFNPEIFLYIKNFGNKDDCGVVAELDGKVVGIAWTRIIPAYGNIDDKTPELAISVLPEYRGQGIGTKLMTDLFDLLQKNGYHRTSLSVQKDNPALNFYKRLGYKITNEKIDPVENKDYIMAKKL